MSKYKTRIADVAAAAQVSVATVDRVLNLRGGVSEAVQARVLEAARRLKIDRVLQVAPGRWLKLDILLHSPTIHFYAELAQCFEQHLLALESLRIHCNVLHFNQLAAAEVAELIELQGQKADALIVVTHDHPLVNGAMRRVAHHCAIFTVASDLPNSGRLAYVGPDNRAGGRTAAALMGHWLGLAGGPILMIKGCDLFCSQKDRELGFVEVLRRDFPQVCIVAKGDSREDPSSTHDIVADVLNTVPQLRGVYNISVGDGGVARALAAHRLAHKVVFICHDLTLSNRRLLQQGAIDVVLDQNMAMQVSQVLQHVLAHFGRAAAPTTGGLHPINIVMRENLLLSA